MPDGAQTVADLLETKPAWWGNDYSPFRVPYSADRRWGLKTTLYFVGAPDRPRRMKIGIARDVARRLATFQAGDPDIVLLGYRTVCRPLDRQIERLVHQALADRALGREWFNVTLDEARAAAHQVIVKGDRIVQRMARDGVFGYD